MATSPTNLPTSALSTIDSATRDTPSLQIPRRAAYAYQPADERLMPYFERFIAALLVPDTVAAIRVTGEYVKTPAELSTWWEQIIQPAMYEIGDRWSRGEITVGQEHLATAITQRVMAIYYPMILDLPRLKGTIVVTASPGELHEIGTRIVADLLEISGWDVHCTGAYTPAPTVVDLVQRTRAQFLCISTTLVASLPAVKALIQQVRGACGPAAPQILVGGQAYMQDQSLWRAVGADCFAPTARAGIDYIQTRYQQQRRAGQ
jgi:methanogenic corrinoid protein MtbC1